jgi:hypothetical protein
MIVAETFVRLGDANDRMGALDLLIASADPARNPFFTAAAALGAIDRLGDDAAPVLPQVKQFSAEGAVLPHGRYDIIVQGLLTHLQNPPAE